MNVMFSFRKPMLRVGFLLLLGISLHSCVEKPQVWELTSQELVIGDFITTNSDQYSEFGKLMEATGLESLLNTRGPYTLFLPNDEAMFAYYEFKGVESLKDFSAAFQRELILYHLIGTNIPTGDIGLGKIRDPNAVGDYLSSEFSGSEIIISKHSKIIKRDILTANGLIHVLDRVIDPVTLSVFELVANDPSYNIFSEGLRLSGLQDTLQLISFPYGGITARTRFTVLAVPDSIYRNYGITSVGDLISWCGSDGDSLTYLSNPFYRYMEYHCLNGSYFLSDLETGVYPILSRDNNISIIVDTDYKINFDGPTKTYTGFIIPASNTPAKNGALHAINDILPAIDAKPAEVLFETTDFFDLNWAIIIDISYQRWFDGENTFNKIKLESRLYALLLTGQ
jgi:uncharacterized surface protein with fasciclin (FAS1) repeats